MHILYNHNFSTEYKGSDHRTAKTAACSMKLKLSWREKNPTKLKNSGISSIGQKAVATLVMTQKIKHRADQGCSRIIPAFSDANPNAIELTKLSIQYTTKVPRPYRLALPATSSGRK